MSEARGITISMVINDDLLDKIDEYRKKVQERSGYISRSRVMRMLLLEGLDAHSKDAHSH